MLLPVVLVPLLLLREIQKTHKKTLHAIFITITNVGVLVICIIHQVHVPNFNVLS